MKKLLFLVILALPSLAVADITASLTAASEYTSAGRTQSGGKPAIQGSLTIAHESGFYFSNWASTVDYGPDYHTFLEYDTYFGYYRALSESLSIDTGIAPYFFFGGSDSKDDNYIDYFLTLTLFNNTSIATIYSPDYSNTGKGVYRTTVQHLIPFDRFTLGLEVANSKKYDGETWGDKDSSYLYYGVSLTTDWKGFSWQALATATDIDNSPRRYFSADPALVIKMTKNWSF